MIARKAEIVLQERRTLDEVILSSVKTFYNGCNFRLVSKADGTYYLQEGCYLLVNLLTGDEKLLWKWLQDIPGGKLLSGKVKPETICYLLRMEPCKECGGVRLEPKPQWMTKADAPK